MAGDFIDISDGSIKLMKRDIVSPTKGSVVYYRPDGSGRDSYIKDENGGFLGKDLIHANRNKPFETRDRMRFGMPAKSKVDAPHSKFTHYTSDGSGRDFYVSSNEGGNVHVPSWRDKVDFKFKSQLRSYNKTNNVRNNLFRQTRKEWICSLCHSLR